MRGGQFTSKQAQLSQQKVSSISNRETPSQSTNNSSGRGTSSKNQPQTAASSSLNKYQNSNLGNNKAIQPILRSQREEPIRNQPYNTASTNTIGLKKSSSGPVEKKVKSQQKAMKESPFNYKEQSSQQQNDGTPNRKLFQKIKSPNIQNIQQIQDNEEEDDEDGGKVIEVNSQDQDIGDNAQQYNRPSDEVQYQEFRQKDNDNDDNGSGFFVNKNSKQKQFMKQQQNLRGTQSKFFVIDEETKSTNKLSIINYQDSVLKTDDSGFKVINEEFNNKDNEENKSLMNDICLMNSQQQDDHQEDDDEHQKVEIYQRNSDFKKFNIDEEFQNQQSLRITRKMQDEQNEQQFQKRNNMSYQDLGENINDINSDDDDDDEYQQELAETPKGLRKFKQLEKEISLNIDNNSNTNTHTHAHAHKNSQYQQKQFQQQQIQLENLETDGQDSLQSSQIFIQNPNIISPTSFGSPPQQQYGILNNNKQQNLNQEHQQQKMEHLLSFADHNQMIYSEYPPLQLNQSKQPTSVEVSSQFFKPLSPTAERQQQRLQDILKSSQGDATSLQSAFNTQKLDEQSLNNMIDMEKNYVIMQYENILQQLNVEFHKLLTKNKETEEVLLSKENFIKTQNRLLLEKDEQIFQQESISRQLKMQVQDLMNDMEYGNQSVSQRNVSSEVDGLRLERDIMDSKIHKLQSQLSLQSQVEQDLREQIESVQSRLRQCEKEIRNKEEEMFSIQKDKISMDKDIKNMGDIEGQLKLEISQLNKQRILIEDGLQEQKQVICQLQIQNRQRELEMENLIRENRNLKASLDILQQNYNEVTNESIETKQQLIDYERLKLQSKNHIEKLQREVQKVQGDLRKAQSMLEQAQDLITQQNQNIQSQQNQLVNQKVIENNKNDNYEYFNNTKMNSNFNSQRNLSVKDQYNQGHHSLNSTLQQNKQQYYNDDNEQFYKKNKNNNENTNNQSINQKEEVNTYYSPQRNQRGGQHKQQAFNNQSNQPPIEGKKTIVWPSWGGVQPNQKQEEQYQQQQQNENNNKAYSQQRRKTPHVNQNESQLQEFFNWPNNNQNQQPPINQVRSLEREQKSSRNPQVQQHNQNNSLNYQQQQQQQQQQIYGNTPQATDSSWQNGKNPLAQFSSKMQQQSYNKQQVNQQQSQFNQTQQKPIYNQFQPQQQDQDQPAAGKKSTVNIGQSPIHGKNNRNVEKQITHMQNTLSSLQMDKEMLENEQRRLGAHPKNKQQIEKKQQIEDEVEIVNKNIQNLKQKLRECNAF